MATSADFMRLSPLRGLSPRQRRLLDRRAHVEHTQYEDLLPWAPAVKTVNGRAVLIPAVKRKPGIRLGLAAQQVRSLVDRLVGEGADPAIHLDDPSTPDDEGAEGVTSPRVEIVKQALGDDGLDLVASLSIPAQDLAVCGSFNLGLHWPDGAAWPELVHLDPEWAEPIYASQVRTARARAIAEDLADRAGLIMPGDEDGPHLPVPDGARSQDLAFVRYEWPTDEAAADGGQTQTTDRRIWRRRDYLPDAIVEYEPVEVASSTQARPAFVPLPVEPHMWGVVPLVWLAAPGARAGEVDGPSFLSEPLLSIAAAVDYTRSREGDAVALNCAPLLTLRDVERRGAHAETITGPGPSEVPTDAGAVLELESTGIGGVTGEASLLEMSGEAPKAARDHADSLLDAAASLTGIVRHDPADAGVVQSGLSRRIMLEPTIKTVGAYRAVMGRGLRRFVQVLVKVLRARGVLDGDVDGSIEWPEQVSLTAADLLAAAQALTTASGGPVLSQQSAVRLFAQWAEIEDPAGELARVEDDGAAALAAFRDRMPAPKPAEADPTAPDPAPAA